MTRPDQAAIPLVRKHLPDEPLDTFLDRNWVPILNAFNRAHEKPQDPDAFPLRWALMSPNSKEFISALGRPLAIAKDLEAKPGIWWLSTPDGAHNFVIFSDCHRKNAWKGGQLCVEVPEGRTLSPQSESVKALCRGFEQVWGKPEEVKPDPVGLESILAAEKWFKAQALANPGMRWPVLEEAPVSNPRRKSGASP